MYTETYLLNSAHDLIPVPMGYAGTAGDVGTFGAMVGIYADDFASGKLGEMRLHGVIRVRKDSGTWVKGGVVGWDNDGTGVDAVTGGAATTTTASKNFHLGICLGTFAGNAQEADILLGATSPGTSVKDYAQSTTGTSNGTVDLVPTSGSVDTAFAGTLNKNFTEMVQHINSLKALMRDHGIMAYP